MRLYSNIMQTLDDFVQFNIRKVFVHLLLGSIHHLFLISGRQNMIQK